ncbi:hypothetical protein N7457_002942 [Penicillium paradoxum]|uniref:uncharacterized protein n=1 Tax=Penicillium paradoxum TaxID=176176 RepID=UPI00254670DF|nr:uncharacterized protein N7457_002942 [Penicillium paradoxum]KAJ5787952.1 hypothetical protein N7457_002942 [Penicillium paradoxum]
MNTQFHGAISGRNVVAAPTAQTQNFYFNDDQKPTEPSSPVSTVPFLRDPDFVDRGTILEQINQKLSRPEARVALVGVGGVGKSQLAIEYSYRVREKAPATWILWIHASNASRLEQSCQEIAKQVKIPGHTDPEANMFQLVCAWLRDSRDKWLLILDNVDDYRVLEQSSPPLWTYLPKSRTGSILITTRAKQVATRLVEDSDTITIDAMDEIAALNLLQKKLGTGTRAEELIALAQMLDFMPLAITQAAAYIKRKAPRVSVAKYMKVFQESPKRSTDLLTRENQGESLRRDWEAKNSLLITWQISFDHIRQERPLAADLLSMMSLFDRQGIPARILKGQYDRTSAIDHDGDEEDYHVIGYPNDEENGSVLSFDDEFEEDIQTLRDFSFVSVNADRNTFAMHALVQLATRYWLETHGKLDHWKLVFTESLLGQFPHSGPKTRDQCQSLFPHAQSASSLGLARLTAPQSVQGIKAITQWTSLLCRAAVHADTGGRWAEAVLLATNSMKARHKFFGPEDPRTLECLDIIGNVQAKCGLWKEAEATRVRVREARVREQGLEDPHTVKSMMFLASSYWDQGRWQEAEELNLQVLEIGQRVLEADDVIILTSMHNLAANYFHQGRWGEAENMQIQVMESQKRTVDPLDLSILTSMNTLGTIYYMQQRWQQAESVLSQVVEARQKILGPDNPDTLASMGNLSGVYLKQGKLKEAEAIEQPLLETRKSLLGMTHPDTLLGMHNLAAIRKSMGQHQEAEATMEECVKLREQTIGAHHPDTIRSSTRLMEWRAQKLSLNKEPIQAN